MTKMTSWEKSLPSDTGARLPDFFIAGAAKAGTTSLWEWLKHHPQIFLPKSFHHKEPSFFCSQWGLHSGGKYLEMFQDAGSAQVAGEASTAYLSSPESPGLIRQHVPDAKIIVMLRHPADRAYSLYNYMLNNGFEDVESFEAALQAEDDHRHDRARFNPPLGFYHNYLYFRSGLYSAQLARYQELFPPEQILVLLLDDFKKDVHASMRRVYRFLGVDETFTTRYEVENQGGVPRVPRLQYLLRSKARPFFQRHSVPGCLFAVNLLLRLNAGRSKPPKMREGTRRELLERYAPDVRLTAQRIGRNLDKWLV